MAHLGNISNVSLNIDEPIVMRIDDMPFNKLNLIVGTNGSGKTLILKICWAMAYFVEQVLTVKEHNVAYKPKELLQEIFDKTFTDQNFNGTIKVVFESSASVSISLEKGKIQFVDLQITTGLVSSGTPIFMSSEMRTYDSIKKYLTYRKHLGLNGLLKFEDSSLLDKIVDIYPLYDVVFIEKLISKLLNKLFYLPADFKETLKNYELRFTIKSIGLDLDKCEVYFLDDEGIRHSMSTLSKGEQSLLNMFTFQLM